MEFRLQLVKQIIHNHTELFRAICTDVIFHIQDSGKSQNIIIWSKLTILHYIFCEVRFNQLLCVETKVCECKQEVIYAEHISAVQSHVVGGRQHKFQQLSLIAVVTITY